MLMNATTILHTIRDEGVCCEAEQARRDGDVRILPPWLAIRTISSLLAVGTFGQVDMRADVAATGIRTAVVVLRLESRKKLNTRPYGVQSREGGVTWECVRQFAEVFVCGVCLNFIGEGAADCEIVFIQFVGWRSRSTLGIP
jgi:hypothetical protein